VASSEPVAARESGVAAAPAEPDPCGDLRLSVGALAARFGPSAAVTLDAAPPLKTSELVPRGALAWPGGPEAPRPQGVAVAPP